MRELSIIEIECIVMRVTKNMDIFVWTVDGHIKALEVHAQSKNEAKNVK